LSLWEAAERAIATDGLPNRATQALKAFLDLIENLAQETTTYTLGEQVEQVLARSLLVDHYKKEKGERGEARVENLEELVNATRNYIPDEIDGLDPLASFLAHAALEAGDAEAEAWEDSVQLMSLHSAKGLEFPLVFLTGLEEGLFPHQRSIEETGRLEEERRLCYVGMTRAKKRLVLTLAEIRRLHGSEHYTSPSRFLGEIDQSLIKELRSQPVLARSREPLAAGAAAASGMGLGSRVRHDTFGEGVVVNYEGAGAHARVQVNFEGAGAKWLVLAYARLQSV
jgi:DNA helicase-2/ATP-dependent DNA helicase PcrA